MLSKDSKIKKPSFLPLDTTQEAFNIRFSILRKIGITGRALMAIQLSDNLRNTLKDGIRRRHNDYSDNDIELEAIRLAIGDKLFYKAYTGRLIKHNEPERFSGKTDNKSGKC